MLFSILFIRLQLFFRLLFFNRKKELSKIENLIRSNQGEQPLLHLLEGIKDWLQGNISSEEKILLERIEDLRRQLSASKAVLKVPDFGAGSALKGVVSGQWSIVSKEKKTTVGQLTRGSSISSKWGLLLYCLVRKFKPGDCLELGTCLGISGAYIAAALKENKSGKLATIEASEEISKLAENNFKTLGLNNQVHIFTGAFEKMLGPALYLSRGVSFVFIDGHHDYAATLNYFKSLLPYLKRPAVLVFDDIFWSVGMQKAWKEIEENEEVNFSYEMGPLGVVFLRTLFSTDKSEGYFFNVK
jgi:predicted O-methyltransferase YrrM